MMLEESREYQNSGLHLLQRKSIVENAVIHPLFHLWLKIKHSFILYSSIVITICTDNEFIRLTFIPNWYEYPTKNAPRNFKIEEMMNCQRRENKSTWENGRIVKWLDKKIACLVVSFFLFCCEKLVPNDVIGETTHMSPVATYFTSDHKEILDNDIRCGGVGNRRKHLKSWFSMIINRGKIHRRLYFSIKFHLYARKTGANTF